MDRQLSTQTKHQLCDAFLRIDAMRHDGKRGLYISELEKQLRQPLGHSRQPDVHHDIFTFINACLEHQGALRRFVRIIKSFHNDNRAVTEVERLVAVIEQPYLSRDDRAALLGLMDTMTPEEIEAAWHNVPELPRNPQPDGSDPDALVEAAEITAGLAGSPIILVRFVCRLADRGAASTAGALLRWVDGFGALFGLDPVAVQAEYPHAAAESPETCPTQDGMVDPEHVSIAGTESTTEVGADDVPIASGQRASIQQHPEPTRIWGGVPLQNPYFTGREAMLLQLRGSLTRHSKASVLQQTVESVQPQALQGYGGVGKTQLAIEYAYRYRDHYQLVWWINGERQSDVLASLGSLGHHLELPEMEDLRQRAHTVVEALNTSRYRWLLVYDNVDLPADIKDLVPTIGGHVILTSRNPEWITQGDSIKVDVFERPESLELLSKRAEGLPQALANQLAEKLGDLPLALEQAINFQRATTMPPEEYLQQLDDQVRDLLAEGQPSGYHTNVTALLTLSFQSLRQTSESAAELLELFAHLGPEPISNTLLRNGRLADLSPALSRALRNPVQMSRMIRDLDRFGVARVDPQGNTIQVHRLVGAVLRNSLGPEHIERSLRNAQSLLGVASPSDPDQRDTWPLHAELGPHILPTRLIESENPEARLVALDQARYLLLIGDYRGCLRLGERLVGVWSQEPAEGGIGLDDEQPKRPDGTRDPELPHLGGLGIGHEQTLLAHRHLANALRMTGDYARARQLDEVAFEQFRAHPDFGDEHEHTVGIALGLGFDLSMAGDLEAALHSDRENFRRATAVHGPMHNYTLRAKENVATQLRQLGRYEEALELSAELVRETRMVHGATGERTIIAIGECARDLLGLGRYEDALEVLAQTLAMRSEPKVAGSNAMLNVQRTWAVLLRKTGNHAQAVTVARDAYHGLDHRMGTYFEHTMAARMTYANCLRAAGRLAEARSEAHEAVTGYVKKLGGQHRFTLAAKVNLAIILRRLGEDRTAHELNLDAYTALREALGMEHPYTLAAAVNYAHSLLWARQFDQGHDLMRVAMETSQRVRGERHPETLACALNVSLDEQAVASQDPGVCQRLNDVLDTIATVLGREHPDTMDAIRGKRADCDVEPPVI